MAVVQGQIVREAVAAARAGGLVGQLLVLDDPCRVVELERIEVGEQRLRARGLDHDDEAETLVLQLFDVRAVRVERILDDDHRAGRELRRERVDEPPGRAQLAVVLLRPVPAHDRLEVHRQRGRPVGVHDRGGEQLVAVLGLDSLLLRGDRAAVLAAHRRRAELSGAVDRDEQPAVEDAEVLERAAALDRGMHRAKRRAQRRRIDGIEDPPHLGIARHLVDREERFEVAAQGVVVRVPRGAIELEHRGVLELEHRLGGEQRVGQRKPGAGRTAPVGDGLERGADRADQSGSGERLAQLRCGGGHGRGRDRKGPTGYAARSSPRGTPQAVDLQRIYAARLPSRGIAAR